MRKPQILFPIHKRGTSYTISAVIITSTIVVLVLVASFYAYQVLEQQRGMAEFECAKESILAFNDALENAAWKSQAVRSSRFTLEYGHLELIPNFNTVIVNVTAGDYNQNLYSNSTGLVRYSIQTKYVTFGEGYKKYILGNESLLVVGNTESYGKALVEQASSSLNITLNYRVRAMRTSVIQVGAEKVNYVDIWVIKVVIGSWTSYVHDFDLKARCLSVETISTSVDVDDDVNNCTINVRLGSDSSTASISLNSPDKVVFNLVVTEMQVSV